VIGWVDSLCKDWAAHKFRVHGYPEVVSMPGTLGRRLMCDQYRRGSRIGVEPIRSVATRGTPKRQWKEVWGENALQVQLAIRGMPTEKLAVMTVHYLYGVRPELVKDLHGKAISERTYWRRLHGVHCHIAANLA
jgi:hypothetical protein